MSIDPGELLLALHERALSLPGAHEEFPWGESVIKVRGKIFVFLGREAERHELRFTVKLPLSASEALERPEAKPTGYGLGKSGWVSFRFPPGTEPPLEQLFLWLDESYSAVAPKKLLKEWKGQ